MKIYESGRSMIEMIGVLAIIGVLSVGGIAGYSKAMGKYKVNKCIDQITQIVASTRSLFAGHKDYSSLGTGNDDNACELEKIKGELIKKGHLVPDEMIVYDADSNMSLTNPFGGNTILNCGAKRSGDKKAFVILYSNVPQDACIELATQNWGSGLSSGLIGVSVSAGSAANGIASKLLDGTAQSVMSVIDATNACSDKNNNTVAWKFY